MIIRDESFWSTIKVERMHDIDFPSRATAEQAIFEDIEVFYNPRRRQHVPAQLLCSART